MQELMKKVKLPWMVKGWGFDTIYLSNRKYTYEIRFITLFKVKDRLVTFRYGYRTEEITFKG